MEYEDPLEKAARDAQKYAKRAERLAAAQFWIYIIAVGPFLLLMLGCCIAALVDITW